MHPIVQKFLAGQLPDPIADSLVAGALPLPPLDQLAALAHAVFAETPRAGAALATLAAMPEGILASAIQGPVEPPDPLGLILIHRPEPALLETALLHPGLTAEWMERAVPHLPGALLELPLNNQVLWLQRPAILDLLEAHPAADYGIKRKINEFRRDVLRLVSPEVAQDRLDIIDEVEAGALDRAWSELPLPEAAPAEPAPGEPAPGPAPASAEHLRRQVAAETGEEIPLRLAQRIMKLQANQKIILALKGGKEERTLLIREANRLIQVNVARNPRITEGEIAFIAQMRSVNEEVLRTIVANRDWMKKYPIVKSVVSNPKTPLPLALRHLRRLVDYDLKILSLDRNVPEVLRREAGRLVLHKHG